MLVLSRKKGESIVIDDQIEVTILAIDGDTIKLGIAAPKNIDIHRKEIYEAIQLSNQSAAVGSEFLKDWLSEETTEKK
ncbi:Carbon storage regulator like protein [Paenibacillus nuruki]|uniref:Translational regulator CsrA n=1 Tax=Paenibacillus nuruki TaxID=1886670 RepID=A0A1E3L2X2_9BACL|nr:carbon storage regulator CsrA [Paenibacillus nuruki]ODP27320.1 Carbon storage regulator like protein [Paenibacillus nuruki]CAJ1317860.1 carbon storage regulator CsrA [Paenibacillus nuruki]